MVNYERIFTRFEYARFEIMTNSAVNVLAMGRENAIHLVRGLLLMFLLLFLGMTP